MKMVRQEKDGHRALCRMFHWISLWRWFFFPLSFRHLGALTLRLGFIVVDAVIGTDTENHRHERHRNSAEGSPMVRWAALHSWLSSPVPSCRCAHHTHHASVFLKLLDDVLCMSYTMSHRRLEGLAALDAGILPLLAEIALTEEDMYLRQELAMCFKHASGESAGPGIALYGQRVCNLALQMSLGLWDNPRMSVLCMDSLYRSMGRTGRPKVHWQTCGVCKCRQTLGAPCYHHNKRNLSTAYLHWHWAQESFTCMYRWESITSCWGEMRWVLSLTAVFRIEVSRLRTSVDWIACIVEAGKDCDHLAWHWVKSRDHLSCF